MNDNGNLAYVMVLPTAKRTLNFLVYSTALCVNECEMHKVCTIVCVCVSTIRTSNLFHSTKFSSKNSVHIVNVFLIGDIRI